MQLLPNEILDKFGLFMEDKQHCQFDLQISRNIMLYQTASV